MTNPHEDGDKSTLRWLKNPWTWWQIKSKKVINQVRHVKNPKKIMKYPHKHDDRSKQRWLLHQNKMGTNTREVGENSTGRWW